MGGRDGVVEGLVPEAPAELGLPHKAVAEQDDLYLVLRLGSKVQLRKVGAQPRETVVVRFARENFLRYAGCMVDNQTAQAWVVCEGSTYHGWNCGPTAIKVEVLKYREFSHWG
jgi:hypothetical protein